MDECKHNKFVAKVNSIQCVDCYASFTNWAFINMYNKLQAENTKLRAYRYAPFGEPDKHKLEKCNGAAKCLKK